MFKNFIEYLSILIIFPHILTQTDKDIDTLSYVFSEEDCDSYALVAWILFIFVRIVTNTIQFLPAQIVNCTRKLGKCTV